MAKILTRNTNDYWYRNQTDILPNVPEVIQPLILDHLDFREMIRLSSVSPRWNQVISKYFREGARVRRLAIIPPLPLSSRVHEVLDLANFQRPIGPAQKPTGKELVRKHGIQSIQQALAKIQKTVMTVTRNELRSTETLFRIVSPFDPDFHITTQNSADNRSIAQLSHTWVLETPLESVQSVAEYKRDQERLIQAAGNLDLSFPTSDYFSPALFNTAFSSFPPILRLPVDEAIELFKSLKGKTSRTIPNEKFVEFIGLLSRIKTTITINNRSAKEVEQFLQKIIDEWANAHPAPMFEEEPPAPPPMAIAMGLVPAALIGRADAAFRRNQSTFMTLSVILACVVLAWEILSALDGPTTPI